MFKDGKYYITLKDVDYEVSKEVHEVFYQGERHDNKKSLPKQTHQAERRTISLSQRKKES